MKDRKKSARRPGPGTASSSEASAKPSGGKSGSKAEAKPRAKECSEADAACNSQPAQADSGQPAESQSAESQAERMLRLQADFENYRRRMQREKEDMYRLANEDLMAELLPVLDHFELALNSAPQDPVCQSFVDGVRLVSDQLAQALRKFGLTSIDAEGVEFNPHEHEAVSHLPSAETPENVVMAQTRRGYKLGERVLRAAQVVVSSGPAAELDHDESLSESGND